MAGDQPRELRRRRMDRERVVRTLTFWLRPEFVLRVVNRFQRVAGFDRSIALASVALTATIPLAILLSSVSSKLGGRGTAERDRPPVRADRRRRGGRDEALLAVLGHEHLPWPHRVALPAGRGPELRRAV